MTLDITKDPQPIDIPDGATIRRPDPVKPFVSMSSRGRWSKCALSAVLPQLRTPSGPAAQEGTEAHKVAEAAIRTWFGAKLPVPVVTPPLGLDGFDYSDAGVQAWRKQISDHATEYAQNAAACFSDAMTPMQCLVEHKIENMRIRGVRVYTVADVVLWNPELRRLVVGDYKYGRSPVGVGTAEEPNPQVAGAAALMPLRDLRAPNDETPEQVGLFVYQPRARYGDPWQVLAPLGKDWLVAEYAKLDEELAAVAHAASELAAGRLVEPNPGDQCTYCPSARWCPAASNFGATALAVESGARAVVDLSPAEVMALWSQRSAFKQFEDDLKERVKMLHERNDPSVIIKRRAGNQMWRSPSQTAEFLMLSGRADLLQPPGVAAVRDAGLPADEVAALLTRAPDVLTYAAAADKDASLAANAFAKYLQEKE